MQYQIKEPEANNDEGFIFDTIDACVEHAWAERSSADLYHGAIYSVAPNGLRSKIMDTHQLNGLLLDRADSERQAEISGITERVREQAYARMG